MFPDVVPNEKCLEASGGHMRITSPRIMSLTTSGGVTFKFPVCGGDGSPLLGIDFAYFCSIEADKNGVKDIFYCGSERPVHVYGDIKHCAPVTLKSLPPPVPGLIVQYFKLHGEHIPCLLDSGSVASFLPTRLVPPSNTTVEYMSANGSPFRTGGKCKVAIGINGGHIPIAVHGYDIDPCASMGILGENFLAYCTFKQHCHGSKGLKKIIYHGSEGDIVIMRLKPITNAEYATVRVFD